MKEVYFSKTKKATIFLANSIEDFLGDILFEKIGPTKEAELKFHENNSIQRFEFCCQENPYKYMATYYYNGKNFKYILPISSLDNLNIFTILSRKLKHSENINSYKEINKNQIVLKKYISKQMPY